MISIYFWMLSMAIICHLNALPAKWTIPALR